MTQVLFAFVHPDGTPVANAGFSIHLRRTGLIPDGNGVVVPDIQTFVTGDDGTLLVELQPSTSVYMLVMSQASDTCAGIRYKFYVPQSDVVINAQDLFLDPVPNSEPWDETAIRLLTEAKLAAIQAAAEAAVSATEASGSATVAAAAAVRAETAVADVDISVTRAEAASVIAETQAGIATSAATAASTSSNSAAQSAAEALASKNAAGSSETVATTKAAEAAASAGAAYTSETKAKTSETNAAASAQAAAPAVIAAARFCGVSATAPTTRLDGSALQKADEYHNSVDALRYSWTGTSWVALNSSAQDLETRLASDDGGDMVFTLAPIAGAVKRSVEEIGMERVSILSFLGAYPDYVTGDAGKDSTAAFRAASAYCSAKPGRLLDIGSGSFKITGTVTGKPYLLSGNPGSRITYVNMPDMYGFDHTWSADVGRVMGSIGIHHVAEGANIAGAQRGPKNSNQYFTYFLRYVIYNNFCSGTVRIQEKYSFGWDFGARRWFTIGDCVGAEVAHNNIQGVFDIITDPAGQLTDAGVFADANGAVLSLRMYANNIGPSYYGLEIGDRVFMNVFGNDFLGNMDSVAFVGTILFNEPKIWNNNMNAQRTGVDMVGPDSIMFAGNTIRRHRSGWKGATHDWNGFKLGGISDLKLKDNTVQPDHGGGQFAGVHTAYNLDGCGLSVYDGNFVGVGNDVGFRFNNCAGITVDNTATAQSRPTDVLFDLTGNTRAATIGPYALVSSWAGTVLRKDATITAAIPMFNDLWDQQNAGNVSTEWTRTSPSGYLKLRQVVGARNISRQFVNKDTGLGTNIEIITGGSEGVTSHELRAGSFITGQHLPNTDGTRGLGSAAFRWAAVFASTGAINTSDASHKTDVREMSVTELDVAKALVNEIGMYQFLESVAKNGSDTARWHVGMTVQRAIEIFEAHGLDPFRNAFICYDEWEDQYEDYAAEYEMRPGECDPETGKEISPAYEVMVKPAGRTLVREAGNIYSFRNDQLGMAMLAGVAATQRETEATLLDLKNRLATLENLNG